jgi:hypothetical protein
VQRIVEKVAQGLDNSEESFKKGTVIDTLGPAALSVERDFKTDYMYIY